ncbi:hypothetical protein [Gordonia sihwensis]|uniref:hypothetical protein n=1 Tax=Gordonia sihwensis TaxID=173559 RepID=UPI003D9966F7
MPVTYESDFGTRTVGPVHRTRDGGLIRTDTYTPADHDRESAPETVHAASLDDTSNTHSGYTSACGWCYLGYSHTENEHARKIAGAKA